ncbi:MAG: hypothetical protein M0003_04515 [Acidithiobacillus sp.]|nr:hypothetical protein [Acidithiobacillus sp.]
MKSENDWIERLVPVALTGPLREKALDATRLALTIFHMSPDDVAGAIGQAAQIRGVAVDSPKAWIKFYRDMAGQMDVVGKKVVDSRLRAIGNGLGYSSAETKALYQSGVFEQAAGSSCPSSLVDLDQRGTASLKRQFSNERGRPGSGRVGMNNNYSLNSLMEKGGDFSASEERAATDGDHNAEEAISGKRALDRKMAQFATKSQYAAYITFIDNAHLLGCDSLRSGPRRSDDLKETIVTALKTNLLLASNDSARGAWHEYKDAFQRIAGKDDPGKDLSPRAQDRLNTPHDRVIREFQAKKVERKTALAEPAHKASRPRAMKRDLGMER